MSSLYSINFQTHASENPLSDSGAWTAANPSPLAILNGYCQGTSELSPPGNASGISALIGPTLPMDQFAQFTVGTLSPSGFTPTIQVYVRAQGTSSYLTNDGWRGFILRASGVWLLQTHTAGSPVALATGTLSSGPNPGDVFTLLSEGNTVSTYQNSTQLASVSDPTTSLYTSQVLNINAGVANQTGTVLAYAAGTGNPFTPPTPLYFSQQDCRLVPNSSRNVNGTLIYDVQTSDNVAVPGTDSRGAGAPTSSGTYPQNNRAPGTYGPNE